MRNPREYEMATEIVGDVIRSWDPYSLIREGAPEDEFDAEIAKLVTFIPSLHSVADAAQAISDVFSASFEDGFLVAQCTQPAQQMFDRLVAAGLASP
jgi:hypothetical protein